MKEQQKRKIQQFHPEIDDGIDLRRCPLERPSLEVYPLESNLEVGNLDHKLSEYV